MFSSAARIYTGATLLFQPYLDGATIECLIVAPYLYGCNLFVSAISRPYRYGMGVSTRMQVFPGPGGEEDGGKGAGGLHERIAVCVGDCLMRSVGLSWAGPPN